MPANAIHQDGVDVAVTLPRAGLFERLKKTVKHGLQSLWLGCLQQGANLMIRGNGRNPEEDLVRRLPTDLDASSPGFCVVKRLQRDDPRWQKHRSQPGHGAANLRARRHRGDGLIDP